MYKILTRLHTLSPGVFRYHLVKNDLGEYVEFQAETKEEVELEAIKLLKRVGCLDLKVIQEEPFYIDLDYSEDEDFDGEDEGAKALAMLQYMGWGDLRISDNKPFSIDMIWGERPAEEEELYAITIMVPEGCAVEPGAIENIQKDTSRSAVITFNKPVEAFHLVIDGEQLTTGIPTWVDYEPLTDEMGILTFKSITHSHVVEVVIDR